MFTKLFCSIMIIVLVCSAVVWMWLYGQWGNIITPRKASSIHSASNVPSNMIMANETSGARIIFKCHSLGIASTHFLQDTMQGIRTYGKEDDLIVRFAWKAAPSSIEGCWTIHLDVTIYSHNGVSRPKEQRSMDFEFTGENIEVLLGDSATVIITAEGENVSGANGTS